MIHDTQSAQIPQKQDGRNTYAIMKTMCPPGYHHNAFVESHALGRAWEGTLLSCCSQWLERVHYKHEVVGSNPTRANFLNGIGKPWLKMNTTYINKFRYTPMINLKYKFETLVWRLMNGLAQN